MPNELDTDALRRFVRDLRLIREDRSVKLARVHEATQVPESHLQSFESGTFQDQARMSPVYLRAFVRAYADAIGLSPDAVVDHLQSALEGTYQRQLAQKYLDAPSPRTDRGTPTVAEETQQDESDGRSAKVPMESETDPVESSTSGESTEPESVESTVASSPDGSTKDQSVAASRSRRRSSGGRTTLFTTVAVVLLGVAVVGGYGLYVIGSSSSSASTDPAEPLSAQSVSDSSSSNSVKAERVEAERPPERRPPAQITLGDTIHATVLATSVVRELRVRQDDNLRRPYWIEEGEAMVFPFTRRISFRNQLDSLRLFLEQYPYPTTRSDEEGRIVITRRSVQRFADTLRGAPIDLSISPDTTLGTAPEETPDTLSASQGTAGSGS